MSELTERLRKFEGHEFWHVRKEAADEIERLSDMNQERISELSKCYTGIASLTKQRDELIHTMRHIVKAVPTLRNMYIGKRKERSVAGVLMDAIANAEGKN